MTHCQSLALLWSLCVPIGCCAQSLPGTGLEVDDPKVLSYLIGDLPQEATQIGVTIEQIRHKVERRLRQAAIRPASEALTDYHLFIVVSVDREEFHTTLRFVRTVTYAAKGKSFVMNTSTWEDGMDGTHGGVSERIISSIDPLLEKFLSEFVAVNNPYRNDFARGASCRSRDCGETFAFVPGERTTVARTAAGSSTRVRAPRLSSEARSATRARGVRPPHGNAGMIGSVPRASAAG